MAKAMKNDVPMGGASYYYREHAQLGDGLALYAACEPSTRPTMIPFAAPMGSAPTKKRKLLHD